MILKLHDTLNPDRLVVIVSEDILAYPSRGPNNNTSVQTAAGLIGVRETTEEIAALIEAQKTGG